MSNEHERERGGDDSVADAINALAAEIRCARESSMVTRCDLNAAEARIIKAFEERVTPKQFEKLSTKLEAATAPLEAAVAENQPV